MKAALLALASLKTVYANSVAKIDYTQSGANWGESYALCKDGT